MSFSSPGVAQLSDPAALSALVWQTFAHHPHRRVLIPGRGVCTARCPQRAIELVLALEYSPPLEMEKLLNPL